MPTEQLKKIEPKRARARKLVMEMMAILFGGQEAFTARPHILALINTTSPLMIDSHSLGTLMAYVQNGQPVMITPASSDSTVTTTRDSHWSRGSRPRIPSSTPAAARR